MLINIFYFQCHFELLIKYFDLISINKLNTIESYTNLHFPISSNVTSILLIKYGDTNYKTPFPYFIKPNEPLRRNIEP